jgi:predicted cupin superfamily sugar epimerase
MIGLYAESPRSHSLFHRLTHDDVWHVYGGDPFVLHLLHPDGRYEAVCMGSDIRQNERVQYVVTAGTWQAGELVAGGRYALFGCTMAPGFTGGGFEAGHTDVLRQAFPDAAEVIARLGVTHGSTRMPPGFAES